MSAPILGVENNVGGLRVECTVRRAEDVMPRFELLCVKGVITLPDEWKYSTN